MLSLLMRGLKEEDGPRRSSLYSESRLMENSEMSRASGRPREQKSHAWNGGIWTNQLCF